MLWKIGTHRFQTWYFKPLNFSIEHRKCSFCHRGQVPSHFCFPMSTRLHSNQMPSRQCRSHQSRSESYNIGSVTYVVRVSPDPALFRYPCKQDFHKLIHSSQTPSRKCWSHQSRRKSYNKTACSLFSVSSFKAVLTGLICWTTFVRCGKSVSFQYLALRYSR